MNALPKPPGWANVLGVTVGNWGWVVLGGVPVACAVKPSRTGLPGLGSVVVVVVGVVGGLPPPVLVCVEPPLVAGGFAPPIVGGVESTTDFRAPTDGATPSSSGSPGLAGGMASGVG